MEDYYAPCATSEDYNDVWNGILEKDEEENIEPDFIIKSEMLRYKYYRNPVGKKLRAAKIINPFGKS